MIARNLESTGITKRINQNKGNEMKLLLTGEKAPDFALQTVDGEPLGLYEALQNNSVVLLIFLRHLG